MCRASFSEPIFVPVVDTRYMNTIRDEMGPVYEEQKEHLIREGKFITTRMVRFTYGNTWEDVPHPRFPDTKRSNKWSMQLSINDGSECIGRFVESVVYELHPTYKVNIIKTSKAPFTLTRCAWGYFQVKMTIKFRREWNQPEVVLKHMLKFKEGGLSKSILLEVEEPKDVTDVFVSDRNLVKSIADYIRQGAGHSGNDSDE